MVSEVTSLLVSISRVFLCVTVLNICCNTSYGQYDKSKDETSPILEASLRYKPRPKFIEFEFEVLNNFGVESKSKLVGDAEAEINQNLIRQAKIKFPVILKDKVTLIGGLGYRHEQFLFGEVSEPGYPLYVRFEDKPLKRVSSSFFLRKELEGDKFFLAYLNNSLNSDEIQFKNILNQLKSSIALTIGREKGLHKEVGYGLSFGYDLGQPLILPVFFYKNAFSLHWGLEMLLPKQVKLRYSPAQKTHLYLITQLQGASYHIQDEVLPGFSQLEFRRSSARLSLRLEREIHDWLWFGAMVGYREPLNIFLSEPGENRSNSIITINAQGTYYTNISIFIVPPAKLLKRAKGR